MAIATGTLAAMGAMAALSAAKSAGDQAKANSARERNAAVMRYSPWTGLSPNEQVNEPSMIGDITSGAVSGAALGQGMDKYNTEKDLAMKNGSWKDLSATPTPTATPMAPPPPALGSSMSPWMSQKPFDPTQMYPGFDPNRFTRMQNSSAR